MKKIRTSDLRPGMKFNKSVFIDPGNILAGPGVSIKKQDIERLQAWGIEALETAGELTDMGEGNFDAGLSPIGEIARKKAELNHVVEMQAGKPGSRQSKPDTLDEEPAPESENLEAQVQMGASLSEIQEGYQQWLKVVQRAFLDASANTRLDRKSLLQVVDAIISHLNGRYEEMVHCFQVFQEEEEYLYRHCLNVAILGGMVGLNVGLKKQKLRRFLLGCLLIDIGMVKIPAYIHEKKGRLTAEEVKIIRTHPLHGYRILVQENGFPHDSGLVALEHHEQCDGGYPRNLSEDKISLFGKIAALIDTYAAMTQRRSYREEMISYDAMRSVLAAGQTRFDQNILNVFLKQIGVYPIGSYVQLNNNSIGQVVSADPALPMRPNLRVVRDEFGDPVLEEESITLAVEPDLYIVKALSRGEVNVLQQHKKER